MPEKTPEDYKKTRRGNRAGKEVALRKKALNPPADYSLNDHINDFLCLEQKQSALDSINADIFAVVVKRIQDSKDDHAAFARLLMIIPFHNAVSTEKACLLYMLAAQLDIDNQKSPFNHAIQAARFLPGTGAATLFRQIAPHCTGSEQDTLIERISEIEMAM